MAPTHDWLCVKYSLRRSWRLASCNPEVRSTVVHNWTSTNSTKFIVLLIQPAYQASELWEISLIRLCCGSEWLRNVEHRLDSDCCLGGISSFPMESNDRMKSESDQILSETFRRNPTGSDQIASKFEYFRLNPVVFPIGLDRNPWSESEPSTWVTSLW